MKPASDRLALPPARRQRRAWLLAALALPLAACARDATPDLARVAPAGAVRPSERGAWDLAVDDVIAHLSDLLARDHGPLQFERWQLPLAASLEAAQAQLRAALGDGWTPLPGVPARVAQAQLHAWQHGGPGRTPVFALAWLDEPVRLQDGSSTRIVVTAFPRQP